MVVNLEIPEDLLKGYDIKDESHLREIIEAGIRQTKIEEAIHSFEKGKTIDEAAESAGVSPRCLQEMMLQTLARELKPSQQDMKLVIFAGGTGTRFWPLSRKTFPKQFKKIFNDESTLQLAFDRIKKEFDISNIYVSTNQNYIHLVEEQLTGLPADHIIGEPAKRNVGPSVGYILIRLRKEGHRGPVAILWADHLMEHEDRFRNVLRKGKRLIQEKPQRLVFIGEKPRYPESNLGWIHVGDEIEEGLYEFREWYYRPPLEKCKKMFDSGEWYWNPGYFVVDLEFTLCLYKLYVPNAYRKLKEIEKNLGTPQQEKTIKRIYLQFEPFTFDYVVQQVPPHYAVVLTTDLGWSDPGTLYAFKEAMIGLGEKNYTKGPVKELETTDSLIYNEEEGKLVATVGLDGMIVVNTPDALIVVHKDNVLKVTKLVEELEKDNRFNKFV
ncbi:MAG: mannose-1-phosphate guanylyltransferase [Theionarchaea archaeon]|nr:mannose-1-phosphate guanylyltransferase [Theionarchaea archaeon]